MAERDLERAASLAGQLGYPARPDELRRRLRKIQDNPWSALFVAEYEGTVAGFVQINREAQSFVAESRAEVASLVVDESRRGLKIGAALLAAAENWAREKGLRLVRLRSNVTRERAHRFYLRQGYAIAKSWHLFTKDLG